MDPDCLLPPPAYSEQEFDQKITQATALSLQASRVSNTDPDGWPQYDPASFEASFPSEGSSTSPTTDNNHYMQRDIINDLPSVVPLRIEKKSQQRKNLDKPPAIYQPRNESSSLTIGENPAPVYPGTPDRDHFRSRIHSEGDISLTTAVPIHSTQIPNHERGANLIPPPPHSEAQPPAWPPESSPVTRPFVYDNHYQHHVNPYNTTPSQSPRQSLPVQSRPRFVPQGRPMTGYPPSPDNFQSSYVPRLDFNPSVAYGKTQPVTHSPLQQPVKHVQYDPHAFYNSAVSAQLTPTTTGQHGHSSYSPYNSPQRQYQQQGSPATYSRPSHYSQSFVSQDSLSLEGSSPPYGVNSSVLQPARPSSSYSMSSNYQTFNASPSPGYHFVSHTANVPGNVYYDQPNAENRWSTQ